MKKFFLKNMVGVSLAVLILSVITVGIIADQASAPLPEEKNPILMLPKTEEIISSDSLKGSSTLPEAPDAGPVMDGVSNNLSDQLAPADKAPEEFNPLESSSERFVEELEKLGIIPEDNILEDKGEMAPENSLNGQGNMMPSETMPPSVNEAFPALNQNEGASSPVQTGDIVPAPQMGDTLLMPQQDGILSIPQPDDGLSIPPEGELEKGTNTMPATSEVPVNFKAKSMLVKPHLVKATLNFDNDEGPSIPQNPNDPTSEGTGPKGKHKGGPKILARVIRMGENFQESAGFKIIRPWSN